MSATLLTMVLACGVPSAEDPAPERPYRSIECEEPPLVPFDTPPRLVNREEVIRALERGYPLELREAEIQGESHVCALIDERGRVRETRVVKSSGSIQLDLAAVAVVEIMRFRPARSGGQAVPINWTLAVAFRLRSSGVIRHGSFWKRSSPHT